MKNRFFFILSFVLSFLLLGCGGEIKVSIYSRDLQDVMNAKEQVLYTNVNLVVESLKDESDIAFLRNNLNGFSNEHTVEYNYSTSLSFDIKVPIIIEGTNLDFSKDLLIIEGRNNNGNSDFYLKYNQELFSRIDQFIYNSHYQSIDLSKFKIKLEINNDERKNLNIKTYTSYVNGNAYPFTYEQVLNERDRLSFEISEVFSKYIAKPDEANYPIFSIK